MNEQQHDREARSRLFKQVDRVLSKGAHDEDVLAAGRVAVNLGRYLGARLDPVEHAALEVADAFWSHRVSDAVRLEQVEIVGRRRDANFSTGTARTESGYANQIVWCALNSNSGLDVTLGEFLIDIGLGAGLSEAEVSGAFAQVLSEWPAT
jgi:hypothetical protein